MGSVEGQGAALSEEGLSEEGLSGMRDWRAQHPRATGRVIETEGGPPTGGQARAAGRGGGAAASSGGVEGAGGRVRSQRRAARTVAAPCSPAGSGRGGSQRLAARR